MMPNRSTAAIAEVPCDPTEAAGTVVQPGRLQVAEPGTSVLPELVKPLLLTDTLVNEFPLLSRGIRANIKSVPNCQVCLPLFQVRSSRISCVGSASWLVGERVGRSSNALNVTCGRESNPSVLVSGRVNPHRSEFTSRGVGIRSYT